MTNAAMTEAKVWDPLSLLAPEKMPAICICHESKPLILIMINHLGMIFTTHLGEVIVMVYIIYNRVNSTFFQHILKLAWRHEPEECITCHGEFSC